MKKLSICLMALLVSTPAMAKNGTDLTKARFKMSTGLYQMYSRSDDFDGSSFDFDTDINGITLGSGGTRLEGTYIVNKNIDVGAIIEYSSLSQDTEGADSSTSTTGLFATGIYKKTVADDIWAFGQVFVGLYNTSLSAEVGGSDIDYDENYLGGGINVGARYAMTKRIGLDLSAEYMMLQGSASSDGDSIDDYSISVSNIGLRTGIALRF